MMRFKVGGVYNAHTEEDEMAGELGIPIKVTRISGGKIWIRAPDLVVDKNSDGDDSCRITLNGEGNESTCFLERYIDTQRRYRHQDSDSEDEIFDEYSFDATELHVLHPWFPMNQDSSEAEDFHKEIMKTFVFFFISVKLVVLARRAKRTVMERMYAPGGIGFVAAQESFYRAAKSQRIE